MADTVINPVEKCQKPDWAGMLAAGMLQWSSPLLRSALSCFLCFCPTIKWVSIWGEFGSDFLRGKQRLLQLALRRVSQPLPSRCWREARK